MRTLYYVPISGHSERESDVVGKASRRWRSEEARRKREEGVQNFFKKEVPEKINKHIKDFTNLIIYQDGITTTSSNGQSLENIFNDREKTLKILDFTLQETGSPNFSLLKELVEKGAKLEGTENINLVQKQIEIDRNIVSTKDIGQIQVLNEQSKAVVKKRDEFIAKRIHQTLPEDGIGILFMGADHRVDNELKKFPDIKVIYL